VTTVTAPEGSETIRRGVRVVNGPDLELSSRGARANPPSSTTPRRLPRFPAWPRSGEPGLWMMNRP